jgi:hypothetical protein
VLGWTARQMRSVVAGISTSVTSSGASAARIAFISVGVLVTGLMWQALWKLGISDERAPAPCGRQD